MGQISVLLAMRGEVEEDLLRDLHNNPKLNVSRRCADSAEVLAAALAGVGDVALIDSQLGVDRSFLHRLRKAGLMPIVVAPAHQHAALKDMGAQVLHSETDNLLAALLEIIDDESPPAPIIDVEREEPRTKNVIAVMSPWGAPGRTTVAVNLAAELASRGGNPLLIDADLWGASIKQYLGLEPDGAGLAAAIRGVERGTFDSEGLVRLTEECSGMAVLGGINKSDRWREVSGAALTSFWEVVYTWPGYVVIDSPVKIPTGDDDAVGTFGPAPNNMWDSILEIAQDVCLVGTADTVGIHRFVNFYLDGDVPSPHAIINRVRASAAGPRAKESIHELLARFAGVSRPVLIPEDDAVDKAILNSSPLLATTPRTPARQAFEELTDRFLPQRKRARNRKNRVTRMNGAH